MVASALTAINERRVLSLTAEFVLDPGDSYAAPEHGHQLGIIRSMRPPEKQDYAV